MRPLRAIGFRPALIGDAVFATAQAQYVRACHPDAYVNWVVAAKCSQAAPLWLNHPAIDRILVTESSEGYGPRELEIAKECDVVFDPTPQHPDGDDWPNQRNVYAESWRMARLPEDVYATLPDEVRIPILYRWFKTERRAKTIAIWPGARQGEKENRRNPPWEWWRRLVHNLAHSGYAILQCGHPNDAALFPYARDARDCSFMDLIALSLGCDLAIGTDSGSMVALAAYHETPTLSLLSPHWPGHTRNPMAFGPIGKRHTNVWAASNHAHDIEAVVATIKTLTA